MLEIIARARVIEHDETVPGHAIETVRELVQQLLSISAQLRKTQEERDMLRQALESESRIATLDCWLQ